MKRIAGFVLAVLMLLPVCSVRAEDYPGKAWCLMDGPTGQLLLAKNEHEPLAPASVTKVMTLLLILEALDAGQIAWDTPVTASEAAAAKGGSQIYLRAGETMPVTDMVKSIAISSANDCACAMAELLAGSEAAFVEKMNARAAELGMQDTHFVNCTGLDDGENAAQHRTSAYDIALMSRRLIMDHPQIRTFTTTWMDSVRGGAFGLTNTNRLVRFYPGCTGLKTGYTSGAGFCLSATARREGLDLIAVVLGCGSSAERFDACRRLLDRGFATWALYEVPLRAPAVPVRLGRVPAVTPVPAGPPRLLVEKSRLATLETELSLPAQIPAPVEAGAELGCVTVRSGGEVLARIPLCAPDAVARRSWAELFADLIGKIAMAS